MIVCQTCREEVDPSDPNVLVAFEQVESNAFQVGRQMHDGLKVCFHRGCYPQGSPRYRLAADDE